MEKYLFYGMTGDKLVFQHIFMNALTLAEQGKTVKIIFEGASVKLIPLFIMEKNPLYLAALDKGLIAGICRGCSRAYGVADRLKDQEIPLLKDMFGHVGMASYLEEGYIPICM